ncbi:MAG: ATP-binding protein [Pyrinomonadaceae bacterium]
MPSIDVFQLREDLVKTIIRDTIETYSGQWRLVHEAIQNAHDAIQKNTAIAEGLIEIDFFFASNTVQVRDNGTGINIDKFGNIFLLGAGDKKRADLRKLLKGSQGVGIKSTLFTSRVFSVDTAHDGTCWNFEVADFYRYSESGFDSSLTPPDPVACDRSNGSVFKYSLEDYSIQEFFAEIANEYIEETSNEADQIANIEGFKSIVETYFRTKTYVGCVLAMLGLNTELKPIKVEVKLHFDYGSAEEHEQMSIEHCSFLSDSKFHSSVIPISFPRKYLDIAEMHAALDRLHQVDIFQSDFKAVLNSPPESSKRKLLVQKFTKDNIAELLSHLKRDRLTGNLQFEANATLLRKHRVVLNHINGMYLVVGQRTYLAKYFHIGARQHISVNGLPTNIALNLPHGALSYLNNVYVVLDVDYTLGFGKRNLPGRAKGSIDALFTDIWNMLRKVAPKIVGQREGRDPSELQAWDKDEELGVYNDASNWFRALPLALKTVPREEQEVVALFFELIGRKILTGYFPFRVGGNRATYDALFYIDTDGGERMPERIRARDLKTIEFKFRLSEVIGEFLDDLKFLEDINLLVCWENDFEDDTSEYSVHSLEREGISPLPGAQLRIQKGTRSCQVLVLKDLIESLELTLPSET